MFKKILLSLLVSALLMTGVGTVNAADADESINFTTLTQVDLGTFNEYRYRITEQFFDLRNKFELNGSLNKTTVKNIANLVKTSYNYLPDNLDNRNYYTKLATALDRGMKYPDSQSSYNGVIVALQEYLEDTDIQKVSGKIEAAPKEGNAPLTVTLRGRVKDPTGTKIPSYNYIWWIDEGGKRKIIGKKQSINYTFREEGTFSVFLDVVSSHKNAKGFTDVLPFRSRADIKVKEKIASVIINVDGTPLRQKDLIKFTPDEARFGLTFDATSSTAASGEKFQRTTWDFGNGVERTYEGNPRVERVTYAKEGEFTVKLELKTNTRGTVKREFVVSVHDPIATIKSSQDDGFLGDKFTLSAENSTNEKNLSFSWEIIDIDRDEVILRKSGSLFTYTFNKKGKYNVKLEVTEPSGEVDVDSKIIYINSRAPEADFKSSIPLSSKPNRVFLDATKSYDPDFSDEGKLEFSWIIDGERVELEDANYNGSTGFYTFDSIGDHSVVLEVVDPDGISSQESKKVNIKSILSVEFFIFPRVAPRDANVRFVADAPEARFYEWDFGDGEKIGGNNSKISHTYTKSGIFQVKLKVRDKDDKENTFVKNVYIGESDSPYAFINIKGSQNKEISFRKDACSGNDAYIINRVETITFSGEESIDISGQNSGLEYSWKLEQDKYYSNKTFTRGFDELGCFPVKLTVTSTKNGRTHSVTTWVKVENEKPTLSSVNVQVVDDSTDPVVVKISALGAKDIDGVIQSYLWYYYTDVDTEPQDFRATKSPSTTFVLPKITGNYYFVVVMKDNNEARITSEEITGSKYFITLSGDNINTPILGMYVDDSSVSIGEEATFNVKVENILGQDISKKAEYSWDLDGDGFYERKGSSPTMTYKYENSGEFHAKVKAKYKGFSNTKSITMNVSNILRPNFSYISIGNTYIFADTSIGSKDSVVWDLGDGTMVRDEEIFTHTYEDGASAHEVEMKISEGTKVKAANAKVLKNVKNRLYARRDGLVIFTTPEIVGASDEIILEDTAEKVLVYLGASNGDIQNYIIDFDIEIDSDLNGGKDDDIDNIGDDSYTKGDALFVELNDRKTQKVRVLVTDTAGDIIDSYDFKIIKNYIELEEIDIDALDFGSISDSEKLKIEKLKGYVRNLPQGEKLKALMYVQKLQEEWFDNTEKTRVILEFEAYIGEIIPDEADEIINTLESLLVEGQDDRSEKNITFNALKNLIPQTILCTKEDGTEEACYEMLIEKLEAIKVSSDIEANKILGSEILKEVATDESMTNKQKTDFKSILKPFVYGGLENVPQEEVTEEPEDNGEGIDVFGIIGSIFFWIAMILLGVLGIIVVYYIYYKLVNKDDNLGFQDFIIEKTSGVKVKKDKVNSEGRENALGQTVEGDILSDITPKVEEEKVEEEVKEEAPKIEETSKIQEPKKEIFEKKEEEKKPKVEENISKADEQVPDWLQGNFPKEDKKEDKKVETPKTFEEPKVEEVKEIKKEVPKEQPKKEETLEKKETPSDNEVPDWLKGSFSEVNKTDEKKQDKKGDTSKEKDAFKKEEKVETIKKQDKKDLKKDDIFLKDAGKTEIKEELPVSKKELDEVTKIEEPTQGNDDIPDWLKGSFSEEKKVEKEAEKVKTQQVVEEKKSVENKTEEVKEEPKKQESKKVKEAGKKEEKLEKVEKVEKEKKKEEVKKESVKQEKSKKVESKKTEEKKETSKQEKKTSSVKKDKKETSKVEKKEVRKSEIKEEKPEEKKNNAELWDDGMKIPDWLQSDDEK